MYIFLSIYTQFTETSEQIQIQSASGETKNEGDEQDNEEIHSASPSSQLSVGIKVDVVASAVALHKHTKEEDGELSIKEGETLEIIQYTQESWSLARNITGETGLVPSNYIILLPESKFKREPL